MYFDNIKNVTELKQVYRQLALKFHPDKGGDTEEMQAINQEYQEALDHLLQDGKIDQNEFNDSWDIVEKVNQVIHIPDITIEICGTWIWISGNTYPVKGTLKDNGFFWAGKKKMWYWRPPEQKRSRRTTQSMNWIRDKYGSESPEPQQIRSMGT